MLEKLKTFNNFIIKEHCVLLEEDNNNRINKNPCFYIIVDITRNW